MLERVNSLTIKGTQLRRFGKEDIEARFSSWKLKKFGILVIGGWKLVRMGLSVPLYRKVSPWYLGKSYILLQGVGPCEKPVKAKKEGGKNKGVP